MANQFLSLSLFLMLLSFFIVMNAISSFEENKAQPVLNSLTRAFATTNVELQKPSPAPVESITKAAQKGDTLEAIEGVFSAHIAGFEPKRNRLGTVMHVKLPIARFENALRVEDYENYRTSPGVAGAFAQTLVTLVRADQGGQKYRIDMILNTETDPAVNSVNNPQALKDDLTRAGAIATRLEQIGLPKKMISIGLKQGKTGMLDVFIRRYEPFVLIQDSQNKAVQ